jgi:peroxiredoxin-like protein
MSQIYTYRTEARWTGGRSGEIRAEGVEPELLFSAPPEFQGETGKWTPETFFVAAVNGCFLTTFVAIAEFSKLEFENITVSAEARLEKEPGQGYLFTEVVLQPVVTLVREEDRARVQKILDKAEKSCLVTRSLQSEVRVEATIEVAATPRVA